jgi:hypothetical protein
MQQPLRVFLFAIALLTEAEASGAAKIPAIAKVAFADLASVGDATTIKSVSICCSIVYGPRQVVLLSLVREL